MEQPVCFPDSTADLINGSIHNLEQTHVDMIEAAEALAASMQALSCSRTTLARCVCWSPIVPGPQRKPKD
jgi:hypothetical protein